MQELFWFFLGGFFYLIIDKLISLFKKVKFISDIKIHSYKLIGFAYEQLIFAMTMKYMVLESNPDLDKEKIKIYKNNDEVAFEEWKKQTVFGLQESVPLSYREALEVENWDELMSVLDAYYKKALKKTNREGYQSTCLKKEN